MALVCATFMTQSNPNILAGSALSNLSSPNPHRLPSSVALADEHLLVAAAKAGDAAAFEELVNRYERKIFRLTMNITGNAEDAEDAMQDAFLKSYTHLENFHGDSRFLYLARAHRRQRSADAAAQTAAEPSLARRTHRRRR